MAKNPVKILLWLVFSFAMALVLHPLWAVTVHVAVTGDDDNPGTIGQPVATIDQALVIIDSVPASGEIIVHGGVYYLLDSISIAPPKTPGVVYDVNRTLTIRADTGETPLFDGGISTTTAPLGGGIFLIDGNFPTASIPEVWHESERIRYTRVPDMTSLNDTDYGMFPYSTSSVAIHPKDGLLPAPGELKIARATYGFWVTRNNVSIQNISFRNFAQRYGSAAIRVGTNGGAVTTNTVISSAAISNCYTGIITTHESDQLQISNAIIRDVVTGIYQTGGSAVVDSCDIRNDQLDMAFAFTDTSVGLQVSAGIASYYDSTDAIITNNTVMGFTPGIFIKTNEPGGPFRIEHNTLIDNTYVLYRVNNRGVNFVRFGNYGKANAIVKNNVMFGFIFPFDPIDAYDNVNATVDRNIFWNGNRSDVLSRYQYLADRNLGANNIVADPMLASPYTADLRLLPTSPAVTLSDDGKPCGAQPAVAALDWTLSPSLSIAPRSIPDLQFVSIKSLQSNRRELVYKEFTVSTDTFKVTITTYTNNTILKTKVVLRDGDGTVVSTIVHDYVRIDTVTLPIIAGTYELTFSVQDANDRWSDETTVSVEKVAGGAYGTPYVRANTKGFVVFANNNQGRHHYIQYRVKGSSTWVKGFNTTLYQGTYSAPYVGMRNIGQQPLIVTGLLPNTVYEYQMVANTSPTVFSPVGEITTEGAARTYFVSPAGVDERANGTRTSPFKTLQYALDLSLPGDDIRLLPGTYFGTSVMFHSGTADAPITIEADVPGTATLNGRKTADADLLISNVQYVTVKNLVVGWVANHGFYVTTSTGVEISGNKFLDMYLDGSGIPTTTGIYTGSSYQLKIHHNLFYKWWTGVSLQSSPETLFVNNTIVSCAMTGLEISAASLRGTQILYNSFNFVHDQPLMLAALPSDRGLITIDYNNYGTLWQTGAKDKVDPETIITLFEPYPYYAGTRNFNYYYPDPSNSGSAVVYFSFSKWKSDTGFDAHSLFADPLFVAPMTDRFDLRRDSPNLLPDGNIIGAFGYLEEADQPPEIRLITPNNGAQFIDHTKLYFLAEATDDQSVAKVDFYRNGTLVGTSTGPVFSVTLTNVRTGAYTLQAWATDNNNLKTATPNITVSVAASTTPLNAAPIVDAGPHATITLPQNATPESVISDDGMPTGVVSSTWSFVAGPNAVDISAPHSGRPTFSFSSPGIYRFRLDVTDGVFVASDEIQIRVLLAGGGGGGGGGGTTTELPTFFLPFRNIFNPTQNETLEVKFQLANDELVHLDVYDRQGQRIKNLLDGEQSWGIEQTVAWSGRNEDNSLVSSGVYLLVLKIGDKTQTKKIVVIK